MDQFYLPVVVVVFVAFLLWNGLLRAPLRPSVRDQLCIPQGADAELESLLEELRSGAKTGPVLQRIKRRVAHEPSAQLQAVYLCAAGDALRRTLSRRGTALRYFIKALKADPACVDARQGMRDLLLAQRRSFRLEQLYWQLLSRLDHESHGTTVVREVWLELAELLERRRSGRVRALALRRLVEQVPDEEEDLVPSCLEG